MRTQMYSITQNVSLLPSDRAELAARGRLEDGSSEQ